MADIVVIAKMREIMSRILREIIKEGEKVGLKINENKTKLMRVGGKRKEDKSIKMGNFKFDEVDKFRYLGIMISNDGSRDLEIKEKMMAANTACYANKNLLKNKDINKKTKIKIYNILIRPVIMYDNVQEGRGKSKNTNNE
ncbi:reverse transcriptase (rna-dependent dna polymerase) [Holotrichia oblita]|uniref:Reverse transcriptase (Rna-dependent dna polymerase) n=1 Tax=Holotrichia oblita TaxID=644536 RepID=A0ACB9T0W3_HOLOL|nr:reverse transcriptase (rna-dependent dna polymerase) [Holotrichia oblita]